MIVTKTKLPGLVVLEPKRFGDHRGWFVESWSQPRLRAEGIDVDFVQDNHSYSANIGTVRGLHCQAPPHAQDKLVRVVRGAIWDIAVDVRRGAATYGQSCGVELSAENGKQLLVPKGFLHGFATLTPDVELLYKCSDTYAPASESAVIWNDPDLNIDWKIDPATAVLSDKDANAPRFADWTSPFEWSPQ